MFSFVCVVRCISFFIVLTARPTTLRNLYAWLPCLVDILKRIQNELFNIGNMLAAPSDYQNEKMPKIEKSHIAKLENDIDYYNQSLPTLNSFILPGGSEVNIWFHIARTLCRRCERTVVQLNHNQNIDVLIIAYLNRLSDALFVFSRWSNEIQSIKESLWDPNKR